MKRGKEPKVTKKDIQGFIESQMEGEAVDLAEAIRVLSNAVSLLKSSDPESRDENLPPEEVCQARYAKFYELEKMKFIYQTVRWLLAGGIISVGLALLFFYRTISEPLNLIYENRKILQLMGNREGWEINPSGLGYKTPWETGRSGKDQKTPPR